jgi:hypothetical protein
MSTGTGALGAEPSPARTTTTVTVLAVIASVQVIARGRR